jgi:drug/metabolite transporter (DMT)-like permease
MDFIYPLIAVVSESFAQTIDRQIFKKHRIAATYLMWLVFVGMFVALFFYIILTKKPLPNFPLVAVSLLVLIALVSFTANIFDYLSLKSDELSLREPMLCFEPLLGGLFGFIFFPAERKPGFLLALMLSVVILLYGTHRRRLGINQTIGMGYLMMGIIFYALLPSIYKVTLPHISPEYIAFFRVTAILLLTTIFMPVKIPTKPSSTIYLSVFSGFIYAIGAVAGLYAIEKLGVVQTSLLLVLAPVLIYLSSYFVLHEKVRMGEVASSILLAIVVIGSTIAW